jgi:hypothetical protein
VLADGMQEQGNHELVIDAIALNLAPGNYFCSMQGEGAAQSVKIAVIK